MFRTSTLVFAAVLAAPALWHGFVQQDLDATTALVRFLLAVPVAAVLLGVPRAVLRRYHQPVPPSGAVVAEAARIDRDGRT